MDLIAGLVAAGFTEHEARTYLALLRDYPATGYPLSKETGAPRLMAREALGRLHAQGAVLETSDGRVTQYRPLLPDVVFDQHGQQYRCLIGVPRDGLRQG
jgi:sugar-specific transcriptional regulator TrmB